MINIDNPSPAVADGGTTDHSALSNLDYASAGHTGFEATVTSGILGVTAPLNTDNSRTVIGGGVNISINTANIPVYIGATSDLNLGSYALRATTVTCSSFYSTSTSVIYSSANPILTVPGQVGVDVTTTSGGAFRIYTDAQYNLPVYQSKSFIIVSPAGAGTYMLWRTPYDYTLRTVYALCRGGTVTGALYKADGNGINCTTATVNAAITGTTTTASNIVASGITSGNFINWITTSTGGTPTQLDVTFNYTVVMNA